PRPPRARGRGRPGRREDASSEDRRGQAWRSFQDMEVVNAHPLANSHRESTRPGRDRALPGNSSQTIWSWCGAERHGPFGRRELPKGVLYVAKRRFLAGAIAATAVFFALTGTAWAHSSASPNFGPNVIVFTPAMAQSDIQAKLDAISAQQVPNAAQFDTSRYSIFFEPGTYGSAADPLVFQVGYYEQVAGLGALPSDTVINGEAQVLNQCPPPDQNTDGTGCTGLVNFWRSLSNLTINVTVPPAGHVWSPPSNDPYGGDCDASTEFWAASQAAPLRRVIVNGNIFLQDYCTNTNISGFVSGGFMSDDQFG